MKITTEVSGNVTVIKLTGKLDGLTSDVAYNEILPQVVPGCHLVFNMGACDYVSSAGLRTLLMLGKQIKNANGYGVMANLTDDVHDVMEMTGFDHIFKNYDSLDNAVKAVAGEG